MNFAFLLRAAAMILTCLPPASAAFAADGQILFDHDKVMAGGITPGDGPGYPATLSVPGSYKLTGNLKPPSNRDGVIADGVEITIDLNGFRIDGTNVANNGIVGKQRNLTVRNGTVQRFKVRGLDVKGFGSIIEDMRISENGEGIVASGDYVRILDSSLINTADSAVVCILSCHIHGNYIAQTGGSGVIVGGGSVLGNTIENSKAFGIVLNGNAVSRNLGIGNNAIIGNVGSVGTGFGAGVIVKMQPNACSPASSLC